MPALFFAVMEKDQSLLEEVGRRVEQLGFDLVDLKKKGSSRRIFLDVRIDLAVAEPGSAITVEDCTVVSRGLEEWLDESGFLGPNYVLEVSSPGIERPIRFVRHWVRFVGSDVSVKLPGRGRVRATIVAVRDDRVVLKTVGKNAESEETELAVSDQLDARLAVDWNEI